MPELDKVSKPVSRSELPEIVGVPYQVDGEVVYIPCSDVRTTYSRGFVVRDSRKRTMNASTVGIDPM